MYRFVNLIHRKLTVPRKVPVPVISVGNITVGGSGKTPLVIELCNGLREMMIRDGLCPEAVSPIGVLSRGYRSAGKSGPYIVGPGHSDVRLAGDEPVMIFRETECPVAVYPDRFVAARILLEKDEVKLLIMDDGFQHYSLGRDLDIVVVDIDRDPRLLELFPAGELREPFRELSRADMVIGLKREFLEPGGRREGFIEEWEELAAKKIEIVTYRTLGLQKGGERVTRIEGKVLAFCGIGRPEYFYRGLRELGIEPEETWTRRDHTDYSEKDMGKLEGYMKRGYSLVTTAKDLTKLEKIKDSVYVLEVRIQMGEILEDIYEKIKILL